MPKIFDDIYSYVHPKGANCNVYIFKDGEDLDFIDSGAGASIIFRWLWKSIQKDGLDPRNIRNIYHSHVHFDHIGADKIFQKKAIRNQNNVNIFYSELDNHRFTKEFSTMTSNFKELGDHFPDFPFHRLKMTKILTKLVGNTLMKYSIPENLHPYKNGEILSIGQRKAKVVTTGGHTEGHSFLAFTDQDRIVANGDATCINEFTSDFGCLLEAFYQLDTLKPTNLIGGHDKLRLGEEGTIKDLKDSRKRIDDMLRPILEQVTLGNRINISSVAYKRVGKFYKIGIANTWAHMTPYCMGKYLEKFGIGKLEITPKCIMYFHVNEDDTTKEKADLLRSIGEDKEKSCSSICYSKLK
jgi:glyoxylase-like metal-dependent hydrolase (beta-lactamase superfamily II)